jgi:acyl-coenzyme A synthetase/AMP-(fatty) acid ligase
MSEISTYISSSPATGVRRGSPGRPQAGRAVVILPVEGGTDPVPAGRSGLIAVHRSDPGLMLGYWRRPEEEAEVYRGDWFVGGDLARMDEDGWVWFEGRRDDLMNAFGYRVSPLEVEQVIARHPAVAEVGVAEVAVRSDVSVIAAFVVPRSGAEPRANDILGFAEGELAGYKMPREVYFVDHLPRTANGKVVRRQLAGLVKDER